MSEIATVYAFDIISYTIHKIIFIKDNFLIFFSSDCNIDIVYNIEQITGKISINFLYVINPQIIDIIIYIPTTYFGTFSSFLSKKLFITV